MDQNRNNDEITIDLRELINLFIHKLVVILLVGLACGALAFIGTRIFVTPEYDSVSKIYILARSNGDVLTTSDLSVSSSLAADYAALTVSRPVLENVIANLNLDKTPKELKDKIQVSSSKDTRILTITASDPDPQKAKKIVDAVREAATVQIRDVMVVDAVNLVEDGNVPTAPARPNVMKNTLIGLILGIILTMIIITIVHIADDTIKTSEDVEKYLQLNVLATISEKQALSRETNKKKKKKKHSKY